VAKLNLSRSWPYYIFMLMFKNCYKIFFLITFIIYLILTLSKLQFPWLGWSEKMILLHIFLRLLGEMFLVFFSISFFFLFVYLSMQKSNAIWVHRVERKSHFINSDKKAIRTSKHLYILIQNLRTEEVIYTKYSSFFQVILCKIKNSLDLIIKLSKLEH